MYVLRLRVKEIAAAAGVSMNKLSQRSEVSYNIVKAIYRNPYKEVTMHTLNRLAAVLEVPPTELLESVTQEQADQEIAGLQQKKPPRS